MSSLTNQILLYRAIPSNRHATEPQLMVCGDNCITCFETGTASVQVWCLQTCNDIPPSKSLVMAPPSVFEKVHPCMSLKEIMKKDEELDHKFRTSSLSALQTLFDIHISSPSDTTFAEQNLMTEFITVLAAHMGASFYKDQSEYEYLSTFCEPVKHFIEVSKCFSEYAADLNDIHKEALSIASTFKETHKLSKDITEEATRTLCMSGLSFISVLADGTPYSRHKVISNVTSSSNRRKHFHLAFGKIASYIKQNKGEATYKLATILLLGSRCIQDATEMNIAVNERTSCCSCGSTVNCFHLQTGQCKPCAKSKQLLCENCNECNDSVTFTNYHTMKEMLKQWLLIETLKREKKSTNDQLLRMTKQNETFCKKNIQLDAEDKKLKYSIEVMEREKKEHKTELKKMKQDHMKELKKLESTLHQLRQESIMDKRLLSEMKVYSQVMSSAVVDQDETLTSMTKTLYSLQQKNMEKKEVREKEDNNHKKIILNLNKKNDQLEKDKKLLKDENIKLERQITELAEEKRIISMEKEAQSAIFHKSLQESESIILEKPSTKSVATWTVKLCSEAATNTETDTECENNSAVDKVLNDRLVRLESLFLKDQSNDKQVIGYPIHQHPAQYAGSQYPPMYNPPPIPLHPHPPSHPPQHSSQIMYNQPYFPQPCFY